MKEQTDAPPDAATLDEMDRLHTKVMGLPWQQSAGTYLLTSECKQICDVHGVNWTNHAPYIVSACNAAPGLVAEVRRLRARLAAAEAVIAAYRTEGDTNWLEDGMAARNARYVALSAYDALAGTGEG